MSEIKYEIKVYWSEIDNCFIAEIPELAGCKSDGNSHENAISNVKIIANEWIETAKSIGREIPKPKGKLLFA